MGRLHEGEDNANEEEETLVVEPTIPVTHPGESCEVSSLKMEGYSEEVQQKLQEIQGGYKKFIAHMSTPINPVSGPNPLFPLVTEVKNLTPISFPTIMSKLVMASVRAPPTKLIHPKRTITHAVLIETIGESNYNPLGTIPPHTTQSSGDSTRPFTLKNLEAPWKFAGKGQPTATTWLTEMSHQTPTES